MDRYPTVGTSGATSGTRKIAREQVVRSRRKAIESLHSMVEARPGFSGLLTGEPGSGKSWLWNRLTDELPPTWYWTCIDLSPALDPPGFLRLIADGMGLSVPDNVAAARLAISSALRDEAADGRSRLLILENAHTATLAVWFEIEALGSSMERGESFAAFILVGRTELRRQLTDRRLSTIAARIGLHVHLFPMDFEEARELLCSSDDLIAPASSRLEELYRDAVGNPRQMLQLARDIRRGQIGTPASERMIPGEQQPFRKQALRFETMASPSASEGRDNVSRSVSDPSSESPSGSNSRAGSSIVRPENPIPPSVIPTRPPLRIEEGLVEVGWSGSLEDESIPLLPVARSLAPGDPKTPTLPEHIESGSGTETIEDHYAALQAWTEWARNRSRPVGFTGPDGISESEAEEIFEEGFVRRDSSIGGPVVTTGIRTESQHEHAPFSQLFSKLKQSQ